MTYSLVNMSALGYDLVRLPHGALAAQVLRTALACGPDELACLTARHPGGRRDERWHRALSAPGASRASSHLAAVKDAVEVLGGTGSESASSVLDRLEAASLGDLGSLEALVRRDILSWTWVSSGDLAVQDPAHEEAADVLCDAAASAYCSRDVPEAARRTMALPFVGAHLPTPQGTGHEQVDLLLTSIATGDAVARERWRATAGAQRPATTGWAPAMHEATWALHLADRLRLAADAQLAAVVAFRDGGFAARDAAYGVWNAISGAVHATVAADLISTSDHDRLTGDLPHPHLHPPPSP